jgi:hypothetical protein
MTKPTDHHPYPYLMIMLDCWYYFEYVKQKEKHLTSISRQKISYQYGKNGAKVLIS